MRDALVGCTGFVGSNLAEQHNFSACYHSTDIETAYGTEPDLLVYAGVRAEMFLANQDPEADYKLIQQAMDNIQKIAPKQIVLISTVAVYSNVKSVDEDTEIPLSEGTAYGRNRLSLEMWVVENYPNSLVVRLPAIYGKNLKKNFLYDYIHKIPALLKDTKYEELAGIEPELEHFYVPQGNGFYKCRTLTKEESIYLKVTFEKIGFSALNFTDSRSRYQFYPLNRLWKDICVALQADVNYVNLVTPPVSVEDVYQMLEGKTFKNEMNKPPFAYDIYTKHSSLYGSTVSHYIMSREEELSAVREFVSFYKESR